MTAPDQKLVEAAAPAPDDLWKEEAQVWSDLWKSAKAEPWFDLPDFSPEQAAAFSDFDRYMEKSWSSWERVMISRDFQNGELPEMKGVSIVRFTGPGSIGRKPHQAGWKEKSMKGMRAVADPSPQLPRRRQQLRYVGLKKTLELEDEGVSP